MESDENISLLCSLKHCRLNNKGEITKHVTHPKSFLQLGRNQFRDIVLKVQCGNIHESYGIKDMKLHTRFVREGKSTITLKEPPIQMFISNCPTGTLMKFLKVLMAKAELMKSTKSISLKERLISSQPSRFQEISPLTTLELNVLINKRQNALPLSNCTTSPKSVKRKREENSTPSRKVVAVPRPIASRLLTAEQKSVMNAVMSGRNVFFTGSAGTGKSFLLKRILGALPPESTFPTASTGVAACQIGGVTLHSFAGIGTGTAPFEQCLQQALKKGSVSWKQCRHLIVDEISMVNGEFFQKLEKIARVVRKNNKPFGGIQLILSGDFLQLPPIMKKGQTRNFCFQSPAWRNSVQVNIELKMVKRQSDKNFINILQDVRMGNSTKEVIGKLKSTQHHHIDKDGILATQLSTHKDDVETINDCQLKKLSGQIYTYGSVDSHPEMVRLMNDQCPVLNTLILKVGAQVMLTKNLDVSKGLVNGARGVVTGFDKGLEKLPIVKFVCGIEGPVKFEKWVVRSNGGLILSRKMLPLKLAWAMSIHKSQGMSLDCVEVSLSRVFECGQAYVALSRARSLEGLRVLDIESSSIRADPEVLKFYSELECSDLY